VNNVSGIFERVARAAASRPLAVLAIAALLTVGGGLLAALTLHPSAGTDQLVGRSSESGSATADYHRNFGDEPIVILVSARRDDAAPLRQVLDSKDLGTLIELEACLTGRAPQRSPISGDFPRFWSQGSPCDQLGRSGAVKVVYGPGTFLNRAVNELQLQLAQKLQELQTAVRQAAAAAAAQAKRQGLSRAQQVAAARAAAQQAEQQGEARLQQQAVQTGLTSIPKIDDPTFVNQVVFDPIQGDCVPKARLAYLFPNCNAGLIQIRLRAGLTEGQRHHTIDLVRQALAMRKPQGGGLLFGLQFGADPTYTVTGVPVVIDGLARSVSAALRTLLIAALLVMAATLAIFFRARLRLLPLLVALGAAGLTFGAMAVAGVSLTMASVAVLPVLIGLAVDYAIQFQMRVVEAERGEGHGGAEAVARAARLGAPTIAIAALATGVGFLVLALSPVPMVRGFGLLLVLGIAVAFACAVTAGSAVMSLTARRRGSGRLVAAARGAGELIDDAGRATARRLPVERAAALVSAVRRSPERVLAVGLALAVIGWVADSQTSVVSDVQKLVPQDLQELRDVKALQDATGVSGEVDVTVRARDLTDPQVLGWMVNYQKGLLGRFGYDTSRGCGKAALCPALSLPDLFGASQSVPSAAEARALLATIPPYFSQAVITPDHREATLAFGIRLMPLSEQQKVVEEMRHRLNPPPGVTARVAGLPVLAAEANDKLTSPARRLLTLLAALLAVALALFAVFRRAERALVPLVPIALATGWSSLLLWPLSKLVPLNPMSVTLSALVIAISTEFSVLLCERYRQERAAGYDQDAALQRTYRRTGAAVLASGVTAIAGFGVLALSDIRMLRDFGIVTVIDLAVSLIGVLLVLPAVLALAERGELLSTPGRWWRALLDASPAGRRRSRAEVA
jgi:hydrophobe/amphiphile efflux-3 (HAE3) family protein